MTSGSLPEIRENVPLAPLTTLGVGGPARYFATAASGEEVAAAVAWARAAGLDVFVLGGGSNVLVSDAGFDGLVLKIGIGGISFGADGIVEAGAGEDWDEFVAACVGRGLAGVECLSGIPGLVGGTPVQNVGAYGQEVAETIRSVRVFDLRDGEPRELSNADCRFAYRASIFNTTARGRFVVLGVTFALTPGGAPKIAYKDLRERFGERAPSLAETRDAVREIRAEKAMLVRQGGADASSAGSFFKNPVVGADDFARIESVAESIGATPVPRFPAPDGLVKVPAAWLIERSGFAKGYLRGRAGLSTRHTLALTNRGGATAADIVALRDEIRDGVRARFGVELHPEPVSVGFADA